MSTPKELQQLRNHDPFMFADFAACAMDEDFVIRAVNHAYVTMTGIPEDELVSFDLFSVFPENAAEPESDGHLQIRLSGERVLRDRVLHHLLVQRYDIPDRSGQGTFLPRYWVPVNRPFLVDGHARGIINRVHPLEQPTHEALQTVKAMRQATGGGMFLEEPAEEWQIEALAEVVEQIGNLGRQVSQLREALVSRATIEQAKGMIIGERGCTPDEAFKILVNLSNDTNVRVAEVSRALVYRAQSTKR